ncbi:hypothetical protein APUTEX25_002237, partial [Auxenochlorella protothecoides]
EERSVRRSGRVAGTPAEFYDEDNLYRSLGIDRLDAFSRRGTRCTAPDPERLAALRAGRGGAAIAARKRAHAWGAWLAAPHAPAAERDSEAADGGEAATCDAPVALEDGSLEPVCTPPEQEAAPPAMRRPKGGSGKLTSLFVATKGALEQLPAMGKEGPALSRKERMLQRMGLSRA